MEKRYKKFSIVDKMIIIAPCSFCQFKKHNSCIVCVESLEFLI